MSPNGQSEFNQIKADLIIRVKSIESFIQSTESERVEFRKIMNDINKKLNGDYMIYPPILGHEQRLTNLELVDKERVKNKETMIKMAVGSITIAVGGAVIWIFNVLRDGFINKH